VRLVTSDQEASGIVIDAFEDAICKRRKIASADVLLPRACAMILTAKDNEHRRVLRALVAELLEEVVEEALEEAWNKLSPEEQSRVRAEGVELRKPHLSLEGEAVPTARQPTAAARKRKRTEEESRGAFSWWIRNNARNDFAQLIKGGKLEVTRMIKSRFAEQTMFEVLNFITRRGVLRAGHT